MRASLKNLSIISFNLLLLYTSFLMSSCQKSEDASAVELTAEERHNPVNALLGIEVTDGLEVTLFASEDMVVNPTNLDIDDKGRIWVTEGVNYRPSLNPDIPVKEEGDRIVILEDTNGDGKADKETVFYQGREIDSALGIMVLGNRVFVSRSPHVFVFTDTTGNDKADTKEILFQGIGGEDHDHGVHAFVFGPDGKLYFNFGDAGSQIRDADGGVIVDKAGNRVTEEDGIYRKGMVFRTNMDGSEFEVLGHNFRNNYEVAVDSYGTLWQSDNDDDGNRSVRINYVMEYGNYGYTDEVTGAGWRTRRVNLEETIHGRHWHQNDPGVVPNLLDTGSGSPTGIIVYEGDLLPEVFQNQMIHTEPGHNVVRAYPVEKDGAGYTAWIENIMTGVDNQWLRQVDVAVAPDGSLFVVDWYDPGVGGHQFRAPDKGRLYRIAPENHSYRVPEIDYNSIEGLIEALKSPNHAIRSNAWLKLYEMDEEAEQALLNVWNSDHSRFRARALWLLSKLDGKGEQYVQQAITDNDPDIRITGLRAARQLDMNIIPVIEQLVHDPSPQVRRDAAIAIRHNESPESAELWAELALQHDGEDRWYLEALGIGADRQWDRFIRAWFDASSGIRDTKAGNDIIWRSRSGRSLPLLADIIRDPSATIVDNLRYFRAFNFHTGPEKTDVLISLLEGDHPDQHSITSLALQQLDRLALEQYTEVQRALDQALERSKGTYEFLDLVTRFQLENQNNELVNLILAFPDSSLGTNAARHMITHGGIDELDGLVNSDDQTAIKNTLQALAPIGSNQSLAFLRDVVVDETRDLETRQLAIEAFGTGSWNAENWLLEMAEEGLIPPALQASAANVLMNAYRASIREGAVQYLQVADQEETADVRPVYELVRETGNIENGQLVYQRTCQICHQVNGQGTHFGPELSAIADKLPREALYNSILEPNAGVVVGYEGYILTLQDESQVTGIISSETADEVELRLPGGFTNSYDKSEIIERERMDQSLMPALQPAITEQELIDLVEYLTTLTN